MKKRKIIITVALAVIIVTTLVLVQIPERIEETITVSTVTGETAEVNVDITCYSSLLLPSYVKGTLSVDGIQYTDRYTKLKEFPAVSDNRLFPSDWLERKGTIPHNTTFLKSDCTDVMAALLNKIIILDIVLDDGVCKIHYAYLDESNKVGTGIKGISFWGPAQNAEDAKQIAESFGYQIP